MLPVYMDAAVSTLLFHCSHTRWKVHTRITGQRFRTESWANDVGSLVTDLAGIAHVS